MFRAFVPRSLLVLMFTLCSSVAPVIAGEPVESASSSAQESLEVTAAVQPEPLEKPRAASTHHQCFQQTRFPPRRAKKKPAPSSSSSQAGPQEQSG